MTGGHLKLLSNRLLLWLGAISYPLYLIHQYVGYVLIDQLAGAGLPLLAAMAVALAIVLGLAHLLHIGVENPTQRMLRRKPALARQSAE
jgi:peptidoglycan/LPS O-acetylase OafA/YrhL